MPTSTRSSQQGQVLVLFTLALTALVLGAAVVVDGGFAFAQRRAAQNAADFAAMAGTRVVGVAKTGRPAGAGTALNVKNAIDAALTANDAQLVSAQYVDDEGVALGDVEDAGTSRATPSASSSTPGPTGDPSCSGSSASSTGRPLRGPRPSRPANPSAAASCPWGSSRTGSTPSRSAR